MNEQHDSPSSATERGVCVALIYALVAERLSIYYEHAIWMTQAQGATRAADWLSRSKRNMPVEMRRQLSDMSDQLAKQIAATTSREAGLYISHEMQESLDSRYQSEIGQSIAEAGASTESTAAFSKSLARSQDSFFSRNAICTS